MSRNTRYPQFNPYRQPVRLGGVSEKAERLKALLEVIRVDGKIEIPVLAGLPPSQGGDAPAATNPGADARLI